MRSQTGSNDSLALRALVFASGAAGLAYEISWSRQLGLVFGQTARAAAIVLGAYFLGMAVGYALSAGPSERMRRPLRGFAVAELAVGLWALLVPVLLGFAPEHVEGTVARVVLALCVLLPGTTALGASLPFVAEAVARSPASTRSTRGSGTEQVARVYASNLAGAVLGVVVATGVLAPVGVVATSWGAAVVSITVAFSAWALQSRFEGPRVWDAATTSSSRTRPVWVAAAAVSGFGALGAQVLYVRLFSFVFHNSTYTFAAILIVVLVGLSLASVLSARLLRRFDAQHALVGASVLAAAALPGSVCAFLHLQGFRYFGWGDGFGSYLVGAAALVAVVVVVPVVAMGVILPLSWQLAGADDRPGRVVGRLTTANTLCAALGAISASFVLVPLFGLWGGFAAISMTYLALAAVVVTRLPTNRLRWGGAIGMAALVGAGATALSSGVDALDPDEVLVARFSGPYGWTDIVTDRDGYHRRIRHNIHYGLGSRSSSPMQLRQGHFPLLLHPHPERVAFIGLATGVTASAALDFPTVDEITVMELIPQVVDAARHFRAENRGLLDDDRVQVRIGDGRSVLGATTERYDVIVSDLFVPWESKTGYLYTVEHFEAVRERLEEDGVFCQWLAGWQVGPRELEIIANSLREAFPHVAVWQLSRSDERPLFALVAVEHPVDLDRGALAERMALRRPPALGRERVLQSPDDVVAWYAGDWRPLAGVPLNTDEHPVVEFSAPVTHRQRDSRLRGERFHAYSADRLEQLPRAVFRFDPPATNEERARPK